MKNITNKRKAASGPDDYFTPKWMTEALLDYEKFTGNILEPSCGDGAIAKVLIHNGYTVKAQDLYDYGYSPAKTGIDFLKYRKPINNIITNPPYNLANEFVINSLALIKNKAAFLLRLSFLEGQARYYDIFVKHPPYKILVFSERATMYKLKADRKGSGTIAYAWFIWRKKKTKATKIIWIKPGFKGKHGE